MVSLLLIGRKHKNQLPKGEYAKDLIKENFLFYCDVKKFTEIYKEIAKLQPDDTLQLILEAETEEEKCFFELIGDFLLQTQQKKVVERNLF